MILLAHSWRAGWKLQGTGLPAAPACGTAQQGRNSSGCQTDRPFFCSFLHPVAWRTAKAHR